MSERPPLESRMVTADDGSQMIVLWDDSWGIRARMRSSVATEG